jgi:PAS domain S-box-containing protein
MKISIRWALIIGCLGLIWVTQVMVTSSTYLSSERVLLEHAQDIMQNIADLTMEQSQNHLALAQGATNLTKRLISSDVVGSDLDRRGVLEKYFLEQLAIYTHFAGIYVGLPNGDFLYSSRSSNGYRTKIITHQNGQRHTQLRWRDDAFSLLDQESNPQDRFDPRIRPWYIKAHKEGKVVWTDPYIFFTSQKPGITIAGPINRDSGQLQAVVGVDLEIDQLSSFISKLRIGKNGRAFLFNSNGDVVAFPDLSKIRINESAQEGKARLVTIKELNDGLSRAAYEAVDWQQYPDGRIKLTEPQFAHFKYDGKPYHAMFAPFENEQWPWIIGVYLPESDYLGSIQANRRFNLWLTVGWSVLASIIGLLLAGVLIRPLAELEKEALAIKQNDLTREYKTNSAFKEIQEVADSFALMKQDIRAGEEKYRGIFENIQDVYYEASLDGTILELSPSIANVSAYSREELIGTDLNNLYQNPQDRQQLLSILTAEGKVSDFEIVLTTKEGHKEYCAINASLKHDESGQRDKIVGSLRVISDRKKADLALRRYQEQLEELVQERTLDLENSNKQLRDQVEAVGQKEVALRASEEKYRSIIENMENGYYEYDLAGNLTFFNGHLEEILGYKASEMIGMNYDVYMEAETARKLKSELHNIRRTGRSLKLSRYTIIRKDGVPRSIEWTAELIRDSEGRAIGYRGMALDISEKIQAEKEKARLKARLQQIQRLEGIGTLAGGVAHDFNNLLMGIQGNVSLMLLDSQENSTQYQQLKSIEACVKGGADLTRQLLGFARGGKYMVKSLDFNSILDNTAQMFGRTRKEIIIHQKTQPDLWAVMADQNQIEQVLLNLYINAWQAMPDGGHIYLETRNFMLDDPSAWPFEIKPGRYVRISVTDTGVGMNQLTQEKIFEPFFTTKEIGRGTGLGLASVYGIIKNHGGIIDFESTLGKGTTFYLYLPATDSVVVPETIKHETLARGNETILLVDDEEVILTVNQPMLEKMGYTVLAAKGGREAIEVFEAKREDIDLVVLDMIMPDMSGGVVFDHLRMLDSKIKVLLSTGYSKTGLAEEILARGCDGFIQKPFNIQQLSAKIREVLATS